VRAAARANINLTIDAEEVDRLELSLDVFEALAAGGAKHHPQWQGFGLAMQAYQTRALDLIAHVAAIARKYKLRLMCRLVKGAYWDSEIKRAQEMGCRTTRCSRTSTTPTSPTWPARGAAGRARAIYPQFAGHNAGTIAAILQMASRNAAPFELQRLHGMGEGVFREVLKNPLISLPRLRPRGPHRDLLAYLVRRLLENGANSSFVHQLADESVGMGELLTSPLRLEPALRCRCRPRSTAPAAQQPGAGPDRESMRAPLLAALAATPVPGGAGVRSRRGAPPLCEKGVSGYRLEQGRRWPSAPPSCAAPPTRWSGRCRVLRAAGEGSLQDLGRRRVRSARGGRLPALLRQ
jgi:RHH-type proline utilization regulon transcriptional repressor/proline dehydrogenase/delta 1-pyrroline-5-carboxylate dehydrogenase